MSEKIRLSHEKTIELIQKAQAGDENALDELVRENLPLVHSVAQKYRCSMEYDDLFQIGALGLVKAVRNFDTSFDVRFSTYAVPMIAGEIKRALRDEGSIKISRSVKELYLRVQRTQDELQSVLGRAATIDEIAQKIGCSAYDVAESLEAMRPLVSIYEPIFDDEDRAQLGDRIASDENTQETIIDELFLHEALSRLCERDRQLINMRYFRNMTQQQTATMLGLSQVQVSRLETKIIRGLREQVTGN